MIFQIENSYLNSEWVLKIWTVFKLGKITMWTFQKVSEQILVSRNIFNCEKIMKQQHFFENVNFFIKFLNIFCILKNVKKIDGAFLDYKRYLKAQDFLKILKIE